MVSHIYFPPTARFDESGFSYQRTNLSLKQICIPKLEFFNYHLGEKMGLCWAADIRSSREKRWKFSFSPRKWTQWSFAISNLQVARTVRNWKWMAVAKFKKMSKPSQKWANMQLTPRWLLFQGFFYWQIGKLLNQSSLGNLFVKHSSPVLSIIQL